MVYAIPPILILSSAPDMWQDNDSHGNQCYDSLTHLLGLGRTPHTLSTLMVLIIDF